MPNDGDPPQRMSIRKRLAQFIAGGPALEAVPALSETITTPAAIRLRLKEFETASVRDVMISRVDMAAVEIDSTLADVLKVFSDEHHSRMPVYRESLDEPAGFIHIKDVVAEGVRVGWNPELLSTTRIGKLVRDIMYVPESTLLPDLLIQMQASRIHIAIVVDEFGGTGGLVCLEDLVEQIVGDIEDEHDEAKPQIARRGRFTWEIDGLADIVDVERETGLSLELEDFESEVETIGGLATALAGRVPQPGETIQHPRGSMIEIVASDPRRVIRLRIRAPKPAPAALAENNTAAVDR